VSATRERQIPLRRMVTIASVARVTHTEPVIVVCMNRAVERQYRRGVRSAGGDVSKLHFMRLNEVPRGKA
jgi:hypothetical protein